MNPSDALNMGARMIATTGRPSALKVSSASDDIPLGRAAGLWIQAQSGLDRDCGECVTTSDASPAEPDRSAQRLILRGGGSAGLGLVIRLGARLLFVFVAARLFGAGLFGAYSAAVGYAIWGTRRECGGCRLSRWTGSRGELRAILHTCAMPTLTDFASALFTRLDLYLVGAMLGQAPAGVYSMARQFRTPIRQVRQSFDGLLTPLIARTINTDGPQAAAKAAASATRLILAIQLGLLVVIVAVGQPMLGWLGRDFASGYWPLVLLTAAETIQGAFGVSDLILLYRRSALELGVTMVSVIENLAAGLLLIGPLGATGDALAVLLAMSAGAIVRRQMLRHAKGVRIPLRHGAGPIVSAMAAIGVGACVEHWLPLGRDIAVHGATLIAALAAYGAILWAWLSVTRESLGLTGFRAA